MWRLTCLFAVLLFALSLVAKDKATLPKLIVNARYVLVTTYFGDEPANSRIMPDDRKAVADVRDAVRKWGRYTLVDERKDADLILLVRKGRVAEGLGGVRIHSGSEAPTSIGPVVHGDAGDPQDMLAVYEPNHGIDAAPLWRGREPDGLDPPEMRLVGELRTKVEAASKKP